MISTQDKEVKAIEDDDMDEVFPTEVAKVGLDDSQLVTVQLKSGCYVRFQVDTGAQCNVLPVHLYQKATKDYSLTQVDPVKSYIVAYGEPPCQWWGQQQFRYTVATSDTTYTVS